MWQPASVFLLVLATVLFLYSFRLSSLPHGFNSTESEAGKSSSSLRIIWNDPANAPYKLSRLGITKLTTRRDALRGLSALISVLAIFLFYQLATKYYTKYVATVGTLLFATSSLLLNNGRIANPGIMLLSLFILMTCGYMLRFNAKSSLAWLATSLVIALSLFVPGMFIFIVAVSVWQLKSMQRPLSNVKPAVLMTCFLVVSAALVVIGYAVYREPSSWRIYLGLPDIMPQPLQMARNAASVPLGVFALAPSNPLYRLGKQPVLDVFTAAMFLLGSFAMLKKHSLDRVKLLGGIFIIATLFIAVSGNFENILILIPFIYFIIMAGLQWMITEWFRVFPKNPLARSGALVLIAIAVFFSCTFQARRYFLAWPHSPKTIAVFEKS